MEPDMCRRQRTSIARRICLQFCIRTMQPTRERSSACGSSAPGSVKSRQKKRRQKRGLSWSRGSTHTFSRFFAFCSFFAPGFQQQQVSTAHFLSQHSWLGGTVRSLLHIVWKSHCCSTRPVPARRLQIIQDHSCATFVPGRYFFVSASLQENPIRFIARCMAS